MRRFSQVLALFAALLLALPAAAVEVVLKDGRVLTVAKPVMKQGNLALLTLPGGQLVSIKLDEIDEAKTADRAAKVAAAPAPTPKPAVTPRPGPAEIARYRAPKKATVIITDADVGPSVPRDVEGKAGDAKVEVVGMTSTSAADGYTVTAQAVNTGGVEVVGVTISLEAVGENNKILASTFAQLARTQLGPGERTALQASIQTDKPVVNFRFVPNWQVKLTVRPSGEAPAVASGSSARGGSPEQAGAPGGGEEPQQAVKSPEAPKPEPTPVPRPDYASPPPNAPVGAPKEFGGTYMPEPSSEQPKQPGGGI